MTIYRSNKKVSDVFNIRGLVIYRGLKAARILDVLDDDHFALGEDFACDTKAVWVLVHRSFLVLPFDVVSPLFIRQGQTQRFFL